jgi:hypothetical protein
MQESTETDLTLRLGLPPFRMNADMKQRLFLWGGGALAALLLVVAMWQILGGRGDDGKIDDDEREKIVKEAELKAKRDLDERLAKEAAARAKKKEDEQRLAKEKEAKEKEAKENDQLDKDKALAEKKKKKDVAYKEWMEAGKKARDEKRFDDAVEAFEAALRFRPEDKVALQELDEARKSQGFQPVFLDIPAGPPGRDEVAAGLYIAPPENSPSVLLQDFGKPGKPDWKRIDLKNSDVLTTRPLVSLPGFRSAVEIPGGVKLVLWGIMAELWPSSNPVALRLFESYVILHPTPASANGKLDLDLTLRRGRIVLSTTRSDRPTRIRLRYHNPVKKDKLEHVDISLLDKNTEVLIERTCLPYFLTGYESNWKDLKHPDRMGPVANLAIVALAGRIQVKVKELPPFSLDPPPGQALLVWNDRNDQFIQPPAMPELPPDFAVSPPAPKKLEDAQVRGAMRRACADLNGRLVGQELDGDLREATAAADPSLRQLSIRARGALNQIDELVDLLKDKNKDVRRAAMQTLEFWMVQDRDNDHVLWPILKKRYKEGEKFMELLHGEAEFLSDYLKNPSTILREMAQLRIEDLQTLEKLMPPKKKKGS